MVEPTKTVVKRATEPVLYQLKALTPIWTGDVNMKPGRLITTGLLGSVRWWFEVLVRGLGGHACDPTKSRCINDKHCVVCELFGCTGWGRKFRFDVLDENKAIKQAQIKSRDMFYLRYTPLRGIMQEEWALLDLTIRLIADYGAIGGKTVFKPTDEPCRERELHHQDFGVVELAKRDPPIKLGTEARIRTHVNRQWLTNPPCGDFDWASLSNFWFVGGQYLARQDPGRSNFNAVIGRNQQKGNVGNGDDSWLAGYRAQSAKNGRPAVEAQSKRIFSFKDPSRTYGFVNPSSADNRITLNEIKQRLRAAWQRTIVEEEVAVGDMKRIQLLTGKKILDSLLKAQGTGP